MTITTNPTRNEYTATAGQTVFSYTFKIFEDTDLNVYQTAAGVTANDTTDLITAYTVAGAGDEDGGTITLTTPASAGDLITIVSDIPASRTTDYQNNGDFRPTTVNNDFDRVVSLVKQVEDLSNRSILFQESQQGVSQLDLPAPVSGQYLRWRNDLSGVENAGAPDITTPTLQFSNYTDLKASTTQVNGDVGYVTGRTTFNDGGQGVFIWSSSDLSTEVAADTQSGIYVAPDSDPTGASGAWVRQLNGYVTPDMFGAVADFGTGNTNNRIALQAAVNFAGDYGMPIFVHNGTYGFSNETTNGRIIYLYDKNITIIGENKQTTIFKMLSEDENGLAYSDGVTSPDGFISFFTGADSTTDISGFTLKNITLDYNASENKLIEGYGNEAYIEPLEGGYPGQTITGYARFRSVLYALYGEDITIEDCIFYDWPRVAINVTGIEENDVKRVKVRGCHFAVTELNPGTNDWDTAGIVLLGKDCEVTNNTFDVTSGGTDYYTARTCIQVSGSGSIITGNVSNAWHRQILVGNAAHEAVHEGGSVSANTARNAKRGIQLLSRTWTGSTADYGLTDLDVSGNTLMLDVSGYALNGADASSPTGISMLELESLGIRDISIHNNIIQFEETAASGGLAGIAIRPTGTGTQAIKNLKITSNQVYNSPETGISVTFADSVYGLRISENLIINPGYQTGAVNEDLAGIAVRGLVEKALITNNLVIDDRATHLMNAAIYINASAGSNRVITTGNHVQIEDATPLPILILANANVIPVHDIPKGTSITLLTAVDGDVTPNVLGWSWGQINNSTPTTITDFDYSVEGQELSLYIAENNTTIQNNANIVTKTGSDITTAAGTVVKFVLFSGVWRQI